MCIFQKVERRSVPSFEILVATVGRLVCLIFDVCVWKERTKLRLVSFSVVCSHRRTSAGGSFFVVTEPRACVSTPRKNKSF